MTFATGLALMDPVLAVGEPPAVSALQGELLAGRYRVLRPLGEGSMGQVFEAEQQRLHRLVAVKLLAWHLSRSERALQRFYDEASAIASLSHPHVVQVIDFDISTDQRPFLVMELLRGETLGSRLRRERSLPIRQVSTIVRHIGAGLTAAHRAGIVHRDLKPENVFLADLPGHEIFAKILDFGISRTLGAPHHWTEANELIGTPEYMAPEQALASPSMDGRIDQHALALVAYEMLTGVCPFAADALVDCLQKVIDETPPPLSRFAPHVPEAAAQCIGRALAKDPAERFASVEAFVSALGSALDAAAQPFGSSLPCEGTTDVVEAMHRARVAVEQGDLPTACALAERVFELHDEGNTAAFSAVLCLGRSLLEAIFMARLSPLERRIDYVAPITLDSALLAGEAFILSRADASMSVADVIDASGLPGVHALRLLVRLESRGFIVIRPQERSSGIRRLRRSGTLTCHDPGQHPACAANGAAD